MTIDGGSIFLTISLFLTILSFAIEYSSRSQLLPKRPNAYIFVLRFVHFLAVLFMAFYIFAFDDRYDIIYIAFVLFVYLHWMFLNNECFLSLLETEYYFGSNKKDRIRNIYVWMFARSQTRNLLLILSIFSLINFAIVILRQPYLNTTAKVLSIVALLAYISYMYEQKHR